MGQVSSDDGVRLHYDVTGSGDAVVLIHGIGSTSRSFTPLAGELGPTYRCIAVDLRGYGDSDDGAVAGGWQTLAEDVGAVLDAERVVRAHVVAASAGALTALELWRLQPQRVRSLTLLGPTLGDAADPAQASRRLAERRVELTQPGEGAQRRAERMVGTRVSPSALSLLQSEQSRIRPAGYGVVAELLARTDASHWLPDVRIPTTVLVGSADAITGPAVAEEVCRLLPGAGLWVLPDVGHSPHVEDPEATAAIVRDWWSRVPPCV